MPPSIPTSFFRRTRQVSVFSHENAARLPYYDSDWNVVQLVWEQLKHSLAIFASDGDWAGFWPTDRPILGSALTVLVGLGLVWFMLSWRHVPRFTIALWFWVGFAGMVATVETPNLQRMATAIPTLPLLAAGVLDANGGPGERLDAPRGSRVGGARPGSGALAVFVALGLTVQQARFYFGTYADMDRWPQSTIQGKAVAEEGRRGARRDDRGASHIRSTPAGARLLAHGVHRASIPSPGTHAAAPLPSTPRRRLRPLPAPTGIRPFPA